MAKQKYLYNKTNKNSRMCISFLLKPDQASKWQKPKLTKEMLITSFKNYSRKTRNNTQKQ